VAQDHVTVSIPVTSSAKIRDGGRCMVPKTHSIDQVVGVGQVGVRVDAPKVRLGVAVLEAAFTCSKFLKHFCISRQIAAVFAAHHALAQIILQQSTWYDDHSATEAVCIVAHCDSKGIWQRQQFVTHVRS